MSTKFSFPQGQRFECRDCPARCCRLPARVRITDEEAERYLADAWVRERVGVEGLPILQNGRLPLREKDRGLQCVFLDDDNLCSMQKRSGHDSIPRTCQAFPFAFARDTSGVTVAQMSHVCPSIRDNYGHPVAKQLPIKLRQKGVISQISSEMATLGGLTLSSKQYLRVARRWEEVLGAAASPVIALARLYDFTYAFERALSADLERVSDAAVDDALGRVTEPEPALPAPRKSPSFYARVLFASLLGYLCYPSRVKNANRIGGAPGSRLSGWHNFANKIAWIIDWGTFDMQYIPRPFRLQRVNAVGRFLPGSASAPVTDYLRLILQRRQLFFENRHLLAVVVDLALATTIISRFARCRAAAEDRTRVTLEDVREGISVAELVLVSHVDLSARGPLLDSLCRLLLMSRASFLGLLASEI